MLWIHDRVCRYLIFLRLYFILSPFLPSFLRSTPHPRKRREQTRPSNVGLDVRVCLTSLHTHKLKCIERGEDDRSSLSLSVSVGVLTLLHTLENELDRTFPGTCLRAVSKQ